MCSPGKIYFQNNVLLLLREEVNQENKSNYRNKKYSLSILPALYLVFYGACSVVQVVARGEEVQHRRLPLQGDVVPLLSLEGEDGGMKDETQKCRRMRAHKHPHAHTCRCTLSHKHTHAHTCRCTLSHKHTHAHTCRFTLSHKHTLTHKRTHARTHMQVHTLTQTHARTHAQVHTLTRLFPQC